jgi:hypothetical protein
MGGENYMKFKFQSTNKFYWIWLQSFVYILWLLLEIK